MFDNIENIKLITSSRATRTKRTVKNRKGHVLVYRINGYGVHYFEKKSIKTAPGDVLLVPGGSSYVFEPLGDAPCTSVSVTFLADKITSEPALFHCDMHPGILNMFIDMNKYYHLHTSYSKLMCLSLLFSILAFLTKAEDSSREDKSKNSIIQPALNYISEHLYDANLKTNTLHSYCGVSPAYFRRVFKASMKLTPQKYIEEKRLAQALSILHESSYPISKIAEMVGYNDPLYFGSVFKKKYGISPSHIRKFGHL